MTKKKFLSLSTILTLLTLALGTLTGCTPPEGMRSIDDSLRNSIQQKIDSVSVEKNYKERVPLSLDSTNNFGGLTSLVRAGYSGEWLGTSKVGSQPYYHLHFESPEWGARACRKQVQAYLKKSWDTPEEFAKHWPNPSRKNTWLAAVKQKFPYEKIEEKDVAEMCAAITFAEHSYYPSFDIFEEAKSYSQMSSKAEKEFELRLASAENIFSEYLRFDLMNFKF